MTTTTNSLELPTLALPHPVILLPSARITIPVSAAIADAVVRLVDSASENGQIPIVAAVPLLPAQASRNDKNNNTKNSTKPQTSTSKLNEWGVLARVIRLVRPPSRSSQASLSLQGLQRIHLQNPDSATKSILKRDALPLLVYDRPPGQNVRSRALIRIGEDYSGGDAQDGEAEGPTMEEFVSFKNAALRMLERLSQDATQSRKREGWVKIMGLVEDLEEEKAGWMADMLVSLITAEYMDKIAYLATPTISARLKHATALFIKLASISEVSTRIASAVDESLSKQQKEFFLRQQLAAIQAELSALHNPNNRGVGYKQGDWSEKTDGGQEGKSELDMDADSEEELIDVRKKIEAMEIGSEERRVGVAEWRRLKRIPQQSAEYGVVRTYLEWLTALPWPSSISIHPTDPNSPSPQSLRSRAFLANAQRQLDADHYGLDRVKRRLIEYLAVVRLREMMAAEEEVRELEAEAKVEAAKKADGENKAVEGQTATEGQNEGMPKPLGPPALKRRRPRRVKGPILLFVGPPGTGKTSLGQSIAKALGRPFQRIALGGVRDEGEIRGHRRTYVASGPGAIVQALRKAGRSDLVLLLDEVDKVGQSNFHGDPAAALLEVLDPEQNHAFSDHYINVPIDLSQTLFICTANTLDTIAAPLLDRCEIIHLSGYSYDEKLHIARRFLLPKQISTNGLSSAQLELSDPALLHIVTHYTREAGVRSLERAIGSVVRFKAVEWAEHIDADTSSSSSDDKAIVRTAPSDSSTDTDVLDGALVKYNPVVKIDELEKILGIARWDEETIRDREPRRGVVYGLVVTGMGEGEILPVESIAVPGTGKLLLTGSLGNVIKESGELALSWVKTHAYDLGVTRNPFQDPLLTRTGSGANGNAETSKIDIHLHLPAGAQKKDGPSAGIAMTCAFVSLLTGACVPPNVAMTGEITLRGRVTPVGGIKEKVLGAHRAGITTVILPWANRKDVKHDVPEEIRKSMTFVFAKTVRDALEAAFGKGTLGWRGEEEPMMESRL